MTDDTQWIEWGGGQCPVSSGTQIDLMMHGVGEVTECYDPEDWCWDHGHDGLRLCDITHYRLRKPPVDWKGIADELANALDVLNAASKADNGVPSADDDDDESVGIFQRGGSEEIEDLAVKFGMMRRADAALTRYREAIK